MLCKAIQGILKKKKKKKAEEKVGERRGIRRVTQYFDHSHYNRNLFTSQTDNLLKAYAIVQLTVNTH